MRAFVLLLLLGSTLCSGLGACTRTVVVTENETAENSGRAEWQALGTRTVHGRNDHDALEVAAGPFRQLRFEVKGSKLEMYNIVVHFANGERYSPDTKLVFSKGSASRVIDLPGEGRRIREIVFHYGNLPRGGRAHVQVFGR
jgi:hypothetical protein